MTDIDLDALEATARAATPSEWHVEGSKFHDSYGHGLGQTFGIYWRQNAEYIATFDPPTVLALLARLREAEACIDAILDYDGPEAADMRDIALTYKTTKTEGNRDEL